MDEFPNLSILILFCGRKERVHVDRAGERIRMGLLVLPGSLSLLPLIGRVAGKL